MHALKEHGGKARSAELKNEVEREIRNQYKLNPKSKTLHVELQNRLDRALELLNRGGLVVAEGIHSLKLTSKALIARRSDLEKLSTGTQTASPEAVRAETRNESPATLPLPDEIALDIMDFMRVEDRLTKLQIEERVLKSYAFDNGVTDSDELDIIRRRVLTARRVLEAKNLIQRNKEGSFQLSERGLRATHKQTQQITGLTLGTFLRREILKVRLFIERRWHLEIREHLLRELATLFAGVVRYFTKYAPAPRKLTRVEDKRYE